MATMDKYLETLQKRAKESRVYSFHQLVGLDIAKILEDEGHKSLYMRLAKTRNPGELLGLAKDIAERKNVSNKGAYFMSMLHGTAKKPIGPFTYSKRKRENYDKDING